jgi:hypothetical protein
VGFVRQTSLDALQVFERPIQSYGMSDLSNKVNQYHPENRWV